MSIVDPTTQSLTPAGRVPHRYLLLAEALRDAAAECQAAADNCDLYVIKRADLRRASVFRQAACVAEHAHWAVTPPGPDD